MGLSIQWKVEFLQQQNFQMSHYLNSLTVCNCNRLYPQYRKIDDLEAPSTWGPQGQIERRRFHSIESSSGVTWPHSPSPSSLSWHCSIFNITNPPYPWGPYHFPTLLNTWTLSTWWQSPLLPFPLKSPLIARKHKIWINWKFQMFWRSLKWTGKRPFLCDDECDCTCYK